jgi:hypothetical protein
LESNTFRKRPSYFAYLKTPITSLLPPPEAQARPAELHPARVTMLGARYRFPVRPTNPSSGPRCWTRESNTFDYVLSTSQGQHPGSTLPFREGGSLRNRLIPEKSRQERWSATQLQWKFDPQRQRRRVQQAAERLQRLSEESNVLEFFFRACGARREEKEGKGRESVRCAASSFTGVTLLEEEGRRRAAVGLTHGGCPAVGLVLGFASPTLLPRWTRQVESGLYAGLYRRAVGH